MVLRKAMMMMVSSGLDLGDALKLILLCSNLLEKMKQLDIYASYMDAVRSLLLLINIIASLHSSALFPSICTSPSFLLAEYQRFGTSGMPARWTSLLENRSDDDGSGTGSLVSQSTVVAIGITFGILGFVIINTIVLTCVNCHYGRQRHELGIPSANLEGYSNTALNDGPRKQTQTQSESASMSSEAGPESDTIEPYHVADHINAGAAGENHAGVSRKSRSTVDVEPPPPYVPKSEQQTQQV